MCHSLSHETSATQWRTIVWFRAGSPAARAIAATWLAWTMHSPYPYTLNILIGSSTTLSLWRYSTGGGFWCWCATTVRHTASAFSSSDMPGLRYAFAHASTLETSATWFDRTFTWLTTPARCCCCGDRDDGGASARTTVASSDTPAPSATLSPRFIIWH